MLNDRVLPFRVVPDSGAGSTGFAGLCAHVELACALGLLAAVDRHLGVAGEQGWLDRHHLLTEVLLNLSGGDCLDDVERLEQDTGLAATGKCEALYCYKGFKAYQPLNDWWAETGLVVCSECRDLTSAGTIAVRSSPRLAETGTVPW